MDRKKNQFSMRKLRDHMVEEKITQEKTVVMMFFLAYTCRIAEVQNINGKIKKIEFLKTTSARNILTSSKCTSIWFRQRKKIRF
jgi:hypothetical protein